MISHHFFRLFSKKLMIFNLLVYLNITDASFVIIINDSILYMSDLINSRFREFGTKCEFFHFKFSRKRLNIENRLIRLY